MDVHFPHVVYKKLKHLQPSFTDLEESLPSTARSLKILLDYPGDVEQDISRTFEVRFWGPPGKMVDNSVTL